MGEGIDLARDSAPEHTVILDNFKDQLLIVLIKRMAALSKDGRVEIPVAEVDDTYQDILAFSVNDGVFHFEARKKS